MTTHHLWWVLPITLIAGILATFPETDIVESVFLLDQEIKHTADQIKDIVVSL